MSNKRVIYWPYVRETIQIKLSNLLNDEFRKTWLEETGGRGFSDSLSYYVFEYLFNNPWAGLWHESYKSIDVTLYNEEEADKISDFIDFWYNNFKWHMPDSYYTNHPKWFELLKRAKIVLDIMEDNSKKYNLAADLESWDEDCINNNLYNEKEAEIIEKKTDERLRQYQEKQRNIINSE